MAFWLKCISHTCCTHFSNMFSPHTPLSYSRTCSYTSHVGQNIFLDYLNFPWKLLKPHRLQVWIHLFYFDRHLSNGYLYLQLFHSFQKLPSLQSVSQARCTLKNLVLFPPKKLALSTFKYELPWSSLSTLPQCISILLAKSKIFSYLGQSFSPQFKTPRHGSALSIWLCSSSFPFIRGYVNLSACLHGYSFYTPLAL